MKKSFYNHQECEKIANKAALEYIADSTPGITRVLGSNGFRYYDGNGKLITKKEEIKRINALAIPPAYHEVWISPIKNSHILASGRDDKNRKQYRYHPVWEKVRQRLKFQKMLPFGQALPNLRRRVDKALNPPFDLNKEQVLSAVIYLLDRSSLRIGNTIYAQNNKTYGVTTLRKKHLKVQKSKASLVFSGKNAKVWHVNLLDKRLIQILKKSMKLPGYELFKYQEEDKIHPLNAKDVNAYLQEITGFPFTAKDFRTWIACRETLNRLVALIYLKTEPVTYLNEILHQVANLLGHTPKICQKSYIFPLILEDFTSGDLKSWALKKKRKILTLSTDNLLLFWLEKVFN